MALLADVADAVSRGNWRAAANDARTFRARLFAVHESAKVLHAPERLVSLLGDAARVSERLDGFVTLATPTLREQRGSFGRTAAQNQDLLQKNQEILRTKIDALRNLLEAIKAQAKTLDQSISSLPRHDQSLIEELCREIEYL